MNRIVEVIYINNTALTVIFREDPRYWKFKVPLNEFTKLLKIKNLDEYITDNEKDKTKCYGACSNKSFGFEYIKDMSKIKNNDSMITFQIKIAKAFKVAINSDNVPIMHSTKYNTDGITF